MSTDTLSSKLKKEVKTLIARAVYEAVRDPDRGLELSSRAKQRLRRARAAGGDTIPFATIKRTYS